MAEPTGFEPAISSVTGWHVGPTTPRFRALRCRATPSFTKQGAAVPSGVFGGLGGTRTPTLRRDLIYSQADQPVVQLTHVVDPDGIEPPFTFSAS